MSDSLMKPCPCCGQQEAFKIMKASEEESFDASNDDSYAIICDFTDGGCGCCGGHRLTLDEAIEVWNRRAPAQQPAAAPSFLGVTLKVDHSLPPNIIEMRGANCVRMDVSTGEIQVKSSAAPVSGDVALPEPDMSDGITDHYTADQLRTYGQQCSDAALERAAKSIDEFADKHLTGDDLKCALALIDVVRALKGGE